MPLPTVTGDPWVDLTRAIDTTTEGGVGAALGQPTHSVFSDEPEGAVREPLPRNLSTDRELRAGATPRPRKLSPHGVLSNRSPTSSSVRFS